MDADSQDSEAASCKMNSLGSSHSIPSTSVSTGSQSSSVNSLQEVLDDISVMHPHDYGSTLDSSVHTEKVFLPKRAAGGRVSPRLHVRSTPNF